MAIFIKLTLTPGNIPFYMRAQDVRTVSKDQKNPLQTLVSTPIMTNQGPLAYPVLESQEEVVNAIEVAAGNVPRIDFQ